MKKDIKYVEYYCDRCGDKVQRLYGRNDSFYTVFLYKDPERRSAEECKIIPSYYRRYRNEVKACFEDSGLCIKCLRQILQKALADIAEEYPELIGTAENQCDCTEEAFPQCPHCHGDNVCTLKWRRNA